MLSRIHMHPGWAAFSLYFLSTHLVTYWGLSKIPYVGTALAAWLVLQVLRFAPTALTANSKAFATASKKISGFVVAINKQVFLAWFRVNFMFTLLGSILAFLSPFVAVSYYTGPVGAIGCLCVFVGVLRWRGKGDLKLYQKRLPKCNPTCAKQQKRVCILGAGSAGLMTLKEMKEQGHNCTVFEKSASIGGVWSKNTHCASSCGSRTTGKTLSSSSIRNSMFGDYQILTRGSNRSYPTHFTEGDFRKYLASYVAEFDLERHVQTSTLVTQVKKRDDGSYAVTYTHDGKTETSIHDVVCVCTGLNQEQKTFATSNIYTKGIHHTSEATSEDAYKGKTVVLVGLGESSTDVASDIAKTAKHVHVIVRSPTLLLPRNTFGTNIAPDHKLTRALLHCPQYLRTLKLMSQTCLFGPFDWMARRFGVESFGVCHDSVPKGTPFHDNWSWDWWVLFHKLSTFHPNANSWALTSGQVTKTAPLIEQYREGKVTFHTSDILDTEQMECGGLKLSLVDGSSVLCDEVVNATGYTTTFPFLAGEGLQFHKIQERYRLVYHPDHPNMPFIGLSRGGVGSIFFGTEIQARWAALVASGDRVLPSALEMKTVAREHASQQAGKWPSKITMVLSNNIARREIGCEPDLWSIFVDSPKAWFYLMFGPFCVTQYRYRGPGACPDKADKLFNSHSPVLVYPLEFALQQAGELAAGFLSRFWSTLIGIFVDGTKYSFLRKCVLPFLDLNN